MGLLAGVQLTALRPSIVIELQDQTVERAPVFCWGLFAGIRYAP